MVLNTIRAEILKYIQDNNLTLTQFAAKANINSGSLSRIANQNQPLSVSQLDAITKAMELEEDHFYSRFAEECFTLAAPNWRRLRPFLIRSAEIGRLDCIEIILHNLLEDISYGSMIFDVAEELFAKDMKEAAKLLYRGVSIIEKYQHSERLAICHYRLFLLSLGDDLKQNLRAATLFEPYVDRLDEIDQLEGLKHLAHVYASLHEWGKVNELSEEMYRIASIQYDLLLRSKCKHTDQKQPARPIYFYMLYARLLQSGVYEHFGEYKKAIYYATLYCNADSWIQEDSEESRIVIKQFNEFSTANQYLLRLLSGETEILQDYIEYLSERPDEIFVGLCYIVRAANKYDCNIDSILIRFQDYIPYKTYYTVFGEYNKPIMAEQYAQFLADLGKYYLRNNQSNGLDYLLEGLEFSAKINSEATIIRCLTMFNQYRNIADSAQQQRFKKLNEEVCTSHEQKVY
ncbi:MULTISPECIES: helix-turn-helix domain-containing protein [Paenibacillus]|uniref:Transcriptional regulator n=1 Tax=Paenibacillus campinasensis TaxID=66347 RepID=A0A268EG45_9BACL|nr:MULTISPECIES: helix-turn-helix transcriptional regulator [Paenibacillus]PAD72100.1 transcriptional regulator [Paenibacillus campinasensis]PAK49038.1 transcriptional regulator [Paenibacillus sp. 7541]